MVKTTDDADEASVLLFKTDSATRQVSLAELATGGRSLSLARNEAPRLCIESDELVAFSGPHGTPTEWWHAVDGTLRFGARPAACR